MNSHSEDRLLKTELSWPSRAGMALPSRLVRHNEAFTMQLDERTLVHGMLTASHFSTIVGMLLPGQRALLTNIEANFVEPVPVGATVTITGRIAAVQQAYSTIRLTFTALHAGNVCVNGKALVTIRD